MNGSLTAQGSHVTAILEGKQDGFRFLISLYSEGMPCALPLVWGLECRSATWDEMGEGKPERWMPGQRVGLQGPGETSSQLTCERATFSFKDITLCLLGSCGAHHIPEW